LTNKDKEFKEIIKEARERFKTTADNEEIEDLDDVILLIDELSTKKHVQLI
jgi:hypothetical protein